MRRSEEEIFFDLNSLCSEIGFAHVLAFLCFTNNTVSIKDKIDENTLSNSEIKERLIRTELSSLIGLWHKNGASIEYVDAQTLQSQIDRSQKLLQEYHDCLNRPMFDLFKTLDLAVDVDPFSRGEFLREAIFYSGDSAYSFQYLEFSRSKFFRDNGWLLKEKKFDISDAIIVLKAIRTFQQSALFDVFYSLRHKHPSEWTILPGFVFTVDDILPIAGSDKDTIVAVIDAFSSKQSQSSILFENIQDFNPTNAYPIVDYDNGTYILFDHYNLFESLYETPFYWMMADKNYMNTASLNRGVFLEQIAYDRLKSVFGIKNVFANVIIQENRSSISGEIDVLVIYGKFLFIVQAKSKRMTINARKGNDLAITQDFKNSIQDSYQQAVHCANLILNKDIKIYSDTGDEIKIPREIQDIYPICLISDHYPALAVQSRQFLKIDKIQRLKYPFVMDVFNLDIMCEFLDTPLYFIDYICKRAFYSDKIHITHELVALSYHIGKNLWFEDKYNFIQLDDSFSSSLDAAVYVRREGFPGDRTPDGILTRLKNTRIGKIIKNIEKFEDPEIILFGLFLLSLSEETVLAISDGIETISQQTLRDGKVHDISIPLDDGKSGVTFHCTIETEENSRTRLQAHCEMRKYAQKANSWFGICLRPNLAYPSFGLTVRGEWKFDAVLDSLTKTHLKQPNIINKGKIFPPKKIGRNESCYCGSGKKYKKCCLNIAESAERSR